MSLTSLIIALIPALGFGFEIISMQLIGGSFTNKCMGMGLTTLFAGLVVYFVRMPVLSPRQIIGATICGAGEALGLIFQVKSLDLVGATMTMPISIGEQLIGNNLIGAIFFGEWATTGKWLYGISAIVVIIVGICLTSYHEQKSRGADVKKGNLLLLISSLGFIAYGSAPNAFHLTGWDVLPPEAVAIFITYVIVGSMQKDDHNQMWDQYTWKNMLTGACDVIANFTLVFSIAINGESVGYTFSQMSVIISTLGGFFILHEARTKKETKLTILGLVLVVIGAILIGKTL
ncbi:GRP family sugar transporter [Limosilactobacillus antri]|uniref:GRP family sugar transporter n=1 Tax=Limosilactobacillus antri TaxID=227943 RepID=UPI001F575FD8|nr:GRP family sugar transporter [Limosilactobacillus antri]